MINGILASHPTIAHIFPEMFIFGIGLLMIAFDMFLPDNRKKLTAWFGVVSLALVCVYLIHPSYPAASKVSPFISQMVVTDHYSQFFRFLFCFGGILVLILAVRYVDLKLYIGEFFALVVLSIPAMMFLVGTTNLLMIYLNIEYIGICSYVLCAYRKDDPKSSEGAIKYLIMGATASAFLVYGMSLLYGLSGSLDINIITTAIAGSNASSKIMLITFTLLLTGFGFKVAMVPFHFWSPDAYEGAPTPATAYFSVLPKAAGIAVLIRVFLTLYPRTGVEWIQVLVVISIITMTVGNVVAILQTNIKRMLAYSSIAHVGYILIGVIVAGALGKDTPLGRQGILAVLIYIAAYLLMNLGAFAVIIGVSNKTGSDEIDSYAGVGRRFPFLALCMVIFLLALAGIPPTAGFTGKFFIFKAAIEAKMYLIALVGIANSVVSVFYYWNIVRIMYIVEPGTDLPPARTAIPLTIVIVITTAAILYLGLFFQPLIDIANLASKI